MRIQKLVGAPSSMFVLLTILIAIPTRNVFQLCRVAAPNGYRLARCQKSNGAKSTAVTRASTARTARSRTEHASDTSLDCSRARLSAQSYSVC